MTRLTHAVYDFDAGMAYAASLPVCQAHVDPERWPESVHDRATDEAYGGEGVAMTPAEFRALHAVPGAAERFYGFGGVPPPVH